MELSKEAIKILQSINLTKGGSCVTQVFWCGRHCPINRGKIDKKSFIEEHNIPHEDEEDPCHVLLRWAKKQKCSFMEKHNNIICNELQKGK